MDIEVLEIPFDGRATNMMPHKSNSLDRLTKKVENQLGGSLEDKKNQGKFLVMIYRKICAFTQEMREEIRELKSLVSQNKIGSEGRRSSHALRIMSTKEDYYTFISNLKNIEFRSAVVSITKISTHSEK